MRNRLHHSESHTRKKHVYDYSSRTSNVKSNVTILLEKTSQAIKQKVKSICHSILISQFVAISEQAHASQGQERMC